MSLEAPPLCSWDHYYAVLEFLYRILSVPWPEGTQFTSWYRSPETNRRVGGHPQSQHLLGLALDSVSPGIPDGGRQLAYDVERAGLIAVSELTHLHTQAWPAGVASRLGWFPDEVG